VTGVLLLAGGMAFKEDCKAEKVSEYFLLLLLLQFVPNSLDFLSMFLNLTIPENRIQTPDFKQERKMIKINLQLYYIPLFQLHPG
jgi:hypothetical protein